MPPVTVTDCYPVGGTCLPIENWQYKTTYEIKQALKQFCDRDHEYPGNCRKYYSCDNTGKTSSHLCTSNWLFRLVIMCYII